MEEIENRLVLDRRIVPFTIVTNEALKDETLKAADKSVYSVLCMYADNKTSESFPSRDTIMKKAGVSDKSLRNSLTKLSDKGYIEVVKRYGKDGRQLSNSYVLLDVKPKGHR